MDQILRRLIIRSFHIEDVKFGKKMSIKNNVLTINKDVVDDILKDEKLVLNMEIDIIKPFENEVNVNTIMDIIPISTKVLGKLGSGISHTLTGVYAMLTGSDEDGRQMHEFGSSEGVLKDHIFFGRLGTPEKEDFIIHIDVKLKGNEVFDRNFTNAAFRASDKYLQSLRDSLKTNEAKEASEIHEFFDKVNPNKKKVVLIKQVAGQGAMYDNMLFTDEPSGFTGGISIINMNNVPIIISPNEYRDGAIRALT